VSGKLAKQAKLLRELEWLEEREYGLPAWEDRDERYEKVEEINSDK
jgi:hypothetical protein